MRRLNLTLTPQTYIYSGCLSAWRRFGRYGRIWEISHPIGSMYAIYGNIYHQYTPNVSIYTIHGSYGHVKSQWSFHSHLVSHYLTIVFLAGGARGFGAASKLTHPNQPMSLRKSWCWSVYVSWSHVHQKMGLVPCQSNLNPWLIAMVTMDIL